MQNDVLNFWFRETEPKRWWVADADFDQLVSRRFGTLLEQAQQAELHHWRAEPEGRLAEIIVLDQFSRTIYRGTARAFAQDAMALALAQEAVSRDAHRALPKTECSFLLMPYMHSESRRIHAQAETLFQQFAPADSHDFELRHKRIIDKFGRYPHRNQTLGRTSTAQEIAFLKQPGSGF